MWWNGCPHYIRTKTFELLQTREKRQQKNDDQDKENLPVIFRRIPYAGTQGNRLVKNLMLKNRLVKMSYYCNAKDRIPDYLKSHVVYEFSCPACNAGYIGKTDRNLGTWIKEHCGLDKNTNI